MGLLRARPGRVDSQFLLYAYLGDEFQETLRARTIHGSTVDRIPLVDMPKFPIRIPANIDEQYAIAHILGTLDEKIELNRRMSMTLDAMARALFKSWFIDFDPVRAKMEGRDVPLPPEIVSLFPSRFVGSQLGDIPAGWAIETLAEHFDAVKGLSYKGSGLSNAGVPLHNLNSIYEGGGYKYEGIKHYTGEYAERHQVHAGDVIVANTEQGHDRLLIGYAAIVPEVFGELGIASHHIYRLRPKLASPLTAMYLCHLLNSSQMHDVVSGYANGTTVNMLPIDGVQRPEIICPPEQLVALFDLLASKVEQRCEEMVSESRTLAALRDTLLPKLISGELRVSDAEKLVGSAA
jgi:type I restriction enzyme S subunit